VLNFFITSLALNIACNIGLRIRISIDAISSELLWGNRVIMHDTVVSHFFFIVWLDHVNSCLTVIRLLPMLIQ